MRKSHGWVLRAAVTVVLGVAVVGLLTSSASFSPTANSTPNSWSTMTTTNPGGPTNIESLNGVSCTSADFCVAVGGYDNNGSGATLAEEWNGSSWTTMSTSNASVTINSFNAVSCISPSSCVAVGSYESDGVAGTLGEEWNGSSWSTMPAPGVDAGVSCTSADFCVAVGSYDNYSGPPLAEEWNGSSWTAMPQAVPGSNANSLLGVSCTSASFCVAVGDSYVSPTWETFIETWNGTNWAITSSPNVGSGGSSGNELYGVSCTSSAFCVGVGESDAYTLTEIWNGTAWTVATSPSPSFDDYLNAVSCTGATSCIAVGYYNTTTGPHQTLAEVWHGSSWTTMTTTDPGSGDNQLNGVSCTSVTFCVAAGSSGLTLAEELVMPAPTTLSAAPALLKLSPLKVYLLALHAQLTVAATGVGLGGQSIIFSAGKTLLCQTTTAADGSASCKALTTAGMLGVVEASGYHVNFAGNGPYLPSSASAGLVG